MAKNSYKISTVFSADNTKFISALEKNKSQFKKFQDNSDATKKKLQTLWQTTHKASSGFDKMRSSVKASTIAMGALIASGIKSAAVGLIGLGKSTLMAASDAQEMQSKFNVVFGEMSKDATSWSKQFVSKVGGSILDVKEQMANSQDLLVGFGAGKDEAFELSKMIQTLGTDLSAFNNIAGDEGIEKLRKGLMGETENLKSLGIIINENIMKQELALKGDKRKVQQLTELEKIQLRYEIAVKQSANAIGSAERESGGFARQMETFKGNMQNLAVEIGSKLLPSINEFVTKVNTNFPQIVESLKSGINNLKETFNAWRPAIMACVVAFTTFKVAILAGNVIQGVITFIAVIKKLREMQLLSAAAQAILNTTILANPIALIVAGVAGAIALFLNWEKVINTVANACKNLWNGLVEFMGLDFLKFDTSKDNKKKKYATGTSYHSGGVALVGEHGPELMSFPSGTSVTPSDKTSQILNSRGSNNTINITINGSNMDADEVASKLVPRLKLALQNV